METSSDTTTNLTIRAMPSWVRTKLAARAKEQHMSLNSYVLETLAKHADNPTMEEVLAKIDAIRRPTSLTTQDAVDAIRADRDAREQPWD
jgi:acyl-CoA hydrolase